MTQLWLIRDSLSQLLGTAPGSSHLAFCFQVQVFAVVQVTFLLQEAISPSSKELRPPCHVRVSLHIPASCQNASSGFQCSSCPALHGAGPHAAFMLLRQPCFVRESRKSTRPNSSSSKHPLVCNQQLLVTKLGHAGGECWMLLPVDGRYGAKNRSS